MRASIRSSLVGLVGIAALVGAGVWTVRGGTQGGLGHVVLNTLVLALAVLVFALVENFAVGLAALLVAGFALVTTGTGLQTLIQNAVDADMRGRVLGAYGMIFRGGTAIGAMLAGAASELVGLQWPVAAGAALCVAVAAWALTRVAALAPIVERSAEE